MTLRPARKLALTTAASAALLTALLTWQASAADSDGTGRESRPGAGASVSDTKSGEESRATPGKGSDAAPGKRADATPGKGSDAASGKSSDSTRSEAEHSGNAKADYWTPERMREARPAPMPVLDR
ncbi:hypothetical protein [Streptomyces flavofungini]|uniref:hypothetical protein n=1 Tax=Streptomyces flavofungini TaxID=68200 RepID=UPI0025AF6789|nr:hypothetical protein [Streptomyces flavofungini]WJV46869.1 hypothetical protein QUY26_15840 [Streptomyces flavofungini]